MKLNVNTDPEAIYYDVYCNGQKLDYCFEADDETDIAWCHVVDENGNIIVNSYGFELIECKVGKIEFKYIDN